MLYSARPVPVSRPAIGLLTLCSSPNICQRFKTGIPFDRTLDSPLPVHIHTHRSLFDKRIREGLPLYTHEQRVLPRVSRVSHT